MHAVDVPRIEMSEWDVYNIENVDFMEVETANGRWMATVSAVEARSIFSAVITSDVLSHARAAIEAGIHVSKLQTDIEHIENAAWLDVEMVH